MNNRHEYACGRCRFFRSWGGDGVGNCFLRPPTVIPSGNPYMTRGASVRPEVSPSDYCWHFEPAEPGPDSQ